MGYLDRRLIIESFVIVLSASILGTIWNADLLRQAALPEPKAGEFKLPQPALLSQAKELFDQRQALFIDAREVEAFEEVRIPGSVSLPRSSIQESLSPFISSVPFSTQLVVYCNGYGCPDSFELGRALREAGYEKVLVLEGGLPLWEQAGYPLERGRP